MNDIKDLCHELTQIQDALEMGLIRPDLSAAARYLYSKEAVLLRHGLNSGNTKETLPHAQAFVQRFVPGQVSQ